MNKAEHEQAIRAALANEKAALALYQQAGMEYAGASYRHGKTSPEAETGWELLQRAKHVLEQSSNFTTKLQGTYRERYCCAVCGQRATHHDAALHHYCAQHAPLGSAECHNQA